MSHAAHEEHLERQARRLLEAWASEDVVTAHRALETLYAEIRGAVRRTCHRLENCLPPHTTEEDVAQEIWIKLQLSRGPTDPYVRALPALLAWVIQVARNHLIDLRRRRRHQAALARAAEGSIGWTATFTDPLGTEETVDHRLRLSRVLEHFNATYPPGARYLEATLAWPEATPLELAESLGTSVENVYQIRTRVTRRVATLVASQDDDRGSTPTVRPPRRGTP